MIAKAPRQRAHRPSRIEVKMSLIVEDGRWRKDKGWLRLIRRAARRALDASPRAAFRVNSSAKQGVAGRGVTVLLAGDARLRKLNREFRGHNKPTNVLSFPSSSADYLGDVALAYETVAREAKAQGKAFPHHAAHLAVHGILHLLGYDHQQRIDAKDMELLEIIIMEQLGLADPYAARPLTIRPKAA